MTIVLDASNLVLGRLASETAKILIGKVDKVTGMGPDGKTVTYDYKSGDKVIIINADKAVITGNPLTTTKRYLQRIHIKVNTNPRRGPFHPRQPEDIVRRAVRGMLKFKTPTGKDRYKNLHVHVGTPTEELKKQSVRFANISAENLLCKRITVGELGRRISNYSSRMDFVEKETKW